jgi:hypothetical protein
MKESMEGFFDLLDEVPRTPTSLLVDERGERRSFPIKTARRRTSFAAVDARRVAFLDYRGQRA